MDHTFVELLNVGDAELLLLCPNKSIYLNQKNEQKN